MISPNMVVDGLTWMDSTLSGTAYQKEKNIVKCSDGSSTHI